MTTFFVMVLIQYWVIYGFSDSWSNYLHNINNKCILLMNLVIILYLIRYQTVKLICGNWTKQSYTSIAPHLHSVWWVDDLNITLSIVTYWGLCYRMVTRNKFYFLHKLWQLLLYMVLPLLLGLKRSWIRILSRDNNLVLMNTITTCSITA